MLHALCVVQTVSLHKLASAMPTSVNCDWLICLNDLLPHPFRLGLFLTNYCLIILSSFFYTSLETYPLLYETDVKNSNCHQYRFYNKPD